MTNHPSHLFKLIPDLITFFIYCDNAYNLIKFTIFQIPYMDTM
ncbi:hypothetical protein Q5A_012690 [Serratia inhibens PRI-2C]|nr:hypothetical protein Q5A_012690 [Serratia inhibens PRI-2C]